jgi:effector-binding domain-containing protein
MSDQFSIQQRAPQPVMSIQADTAPGTFEAKLMELLPEVRRYVLGVGGQQAGPAFSRTHSSEKGILHIEAGIPVAAVVAPQGRIQAGELPGGPMAVAVHVGPYSELFKSYQALAGWITAQGREPAGTGWVSYTLNFRQEPDPARWQTEICIPLRPAN